MSAAGRDDDERARSTSPALDAWTSHDRARAIHPADARTIEATAVARSLVLELFTSSHDRDLFTACARLGALMAEAGASPSLASAAIDGAAHALTRTRSSYDPSRLAPARAALMEGYVAAVREAEKKQALRSWEHPACAVALDDGVVAIACGHPDDDEEALAAWAGRVAGRLAKQGVREAVLAGRERAMAEVASALDLVGIRVRTSGDRAASRPRGDGTGRHGRTWLRWPWER